MKPDSSGSSQDTNNEQVQPSEFAAVDSPPASEPDLPGAIVARVNINPMPQRLAFSVAETAQILGVSEKTVRRLVDRRLLRASRALRHLLIPKKEIERFLDQTTT